MGIDDEQLRQLASMRGLRHLELSETNVLGEGLKHLARLPELRCLRLVVAPLNASGKKHLFAMTNLEELVVWDDGRYERFWDNALPDRETADTVDDDLLARLGSLKKLKTLRFCSCSPRLTLAGMAHLADVRSLRVLAIGLGANHAPQNAEDLAEGLAELLSLDHLTDLTLYGGGTTNRAMEHVARFRSLARSRVVRDEGHQRRVGSPGRSSFAQRSSRSSSRQWAPTFGARSGTCTMWRA